MAKTVDEAFSTLLGWLTPTTGDTSRAKQHRASIEACLKRHFSITRFFRIGSFGNGTSIHGHSDVDYLASFPSHHIESNSMTFLGKVGRALDARFPRTGVTTDPPAVVVPFGSDKSEWTEVVPAKRVGETKLGFPMYHIPDASGGWLTSSPESHNAYVADADLKKSRKVKALVRLVKAWSYYNDVGISSFYLELFTTRYANQESAIIYRMDVQRVLSALKANGLEAIADPRNISGQVSACDDWMSRWSAQMKVDAALGFANRAMQAENEGRTADAFRYWDQVYAGKFPAYY